MSNNLRPDLVDRVKDLLLSAFTLREIRAQTGVSTMTISLIKLRMNIDSGWECPCGKSINHRGNCHVRFARQQKRQAWQRTRGWLPPDVRTLSSSYDNAVDDTYLGSNHTPEKTQANLSQSPQTKGKKNG